MTKQKKKMKCSGLQKNITNTWGKRFFTSHRLNLLLATHFLWCLLADAVGKVAVVVKELL